MWSILKLFLPDKVPWRVRCYPADIPQGLFLAWYQRRFLWFFWLNWVPAINAHRRAAINVIRLRRELDEAYRTFDETRTDNYNAAMQAVLSGKEHFISSMSKEKRRSREGVPLGDHTKEVEEILKALKDLKNEGKPKTKSVKVELSC